MCIDNRSSFEVPFLTQDERKLRWNIDAYFEGCFNYLTYLRGTSLSQCSCRAFCLERSWQFISDKERCIVLNKSRQHTWRKILIQKFINSTRSAPTGKLRYTIDLVVLTAQERVIFITEDFQFISYWNCSYFFHAEKFVQVVLICMETFIRSRARLTPGMP